MQQTPKIQPSEAEMRLSYETAVYKEQLRLLQGEMDRVSLTLLDLENAARTLENLRTDDSILPVGGGAFIKANVYSTHTIIPIGAGYFVEMEREHGVLEIRKRIDSTKKAVDRLKDEFEKISKKFQEISIMLRDLRTASVIQKRAQEGEHTEYV